MLPAPPFQVPADERAFYFWVTPNRMAIRNVRMMRRRDATLRDDDIVT